MIQQTVFLVIAIAFLTSDAHGQPKTITIFHTNDMHASFIPHEAAWIRSEPKPLVGGFNELSFVIDSLRKVKASALLLDAGDVMTGNPITEYDYHGAQGGILFEMMNRLGYDVWTAGNHDFDISKENFIALTKIAAFPTLSANLVDANGKLAYNNKEYLILEKNGLKIGVIGVMSRLFYNLVSQSSTVGIKLLDPMATLQRLVNELDPKTDLLIALTHVGIEDDSVLAMNVHGLDVIVGGHSHTRLRTPKVVNGTIIVQTGSNCENLGVLDLTVENDQVTAFNGGLVQLWYTSERPKTALSLFIDSIQTRIDHDYAEIIGTLETDWVRGRGVEGNIGNFVTDTQREAVQADVAFTNSQGIRKDAAKGLLTKRDLFEALPFRNILTTFTLSGKELKTIIMGIIENQKRRSESIQTSGIICEWKQLEGGEVEIVKLLINGQPFGEAKTYTAAANDYMMGESDRYLGIPTPKLTYTNYTLFETVEKKIRALKSISSHVENRIRKVQ
ncbi:MAG: bifunctional UDP-sugar hydrolase/5'-nucleotidase [bacterium]